MTIVEALKQKGGQGSTIAEAVSTMNGGGGLDYIIKMPTVESYTATVISGTYADARAKLESGKPIVGKIYVYDSESGTWDDSFTGDSAYINGANVVIGRQLEGADGTKGYTFTWHYDESVEVYYE